MSIRLLAFSLLFSPDLFAVEGTWIFETQDRLHIRKGSPAGELLKKADLSTLRTWLDLAKIRRFSEVMPRRSYLAEFHQTRKGILLSVGQGLGYDSADRWTTSGYRRTDFYLNSDASLGHSALLKRAGKRKANAYIFGSKPDCFYWIEHRIYLRFSGERTADADLSYSIRFDRLGCPEMFKNVSAAAGLHPFRDLAVKYFVRSVLGVEDITALQGGISFALSLKGRRVL